MAISTKIPTYLKVSSIEGRRVLESWMCPNPNDGSLTRYYRLKGGEVLSFTEDQWFELSKSFSEADFIFSSFPEKGIRCEHCFQVNSFDDGCNYCGAPQPKKMEDYK